MTKERGPLNINPNYEAPKYQVIVEYSANCSDCGFTISDSNKDSNEKDAIANARCICEGWHYTENRVNGTTCDNLITFTTKTTYLK